MPVRARRQRRTASCSSRAVTSAITSSNAALAVGGGLLGADAVDSAVVRDGEDPADSRAALRVEAGGGAPHLDQGVLGDLLGERGFARGATNTALSARGDAV